MGGLLLGVDAGNTKTVALVARADGEIVGAGRAGCGDIYARGPDEALRAIETAAAAAIGAAGVGSVEAAGYSLAGADWPEDFAFLRTELTRRVASDRPPVVVNDALGALRAGTVDGVGVAVACGTGHAVGARGPDGRAWHSSFWGRQAGAQELGERAFFAIQEAELGLAEPTTLTDAALELFGIGSVEGFLHQVTRRGGLGWRALDRLAPLVMDAADAGDAVAAAAVREVGHRLAGYARVAATRVGLEAPFPLVLTGGVLRHPSPVLADTVTAGVPGAIPVRAAFEPVVGALLLAADDVGAIVDAARLASTLPDAALFQTRDTWRVTG